MMRKVSQRGRSGIVKEVLRSTQREPCFAVFKGFFDLELAHEFRLGVWDAQRELQLPLIRVVLAHQKR